MSFIVDNRPKFERDTQVFGTIDPRIKDNNPNNAKGALTAKEQRVVDSYKIKLFKLANNDFSYKNEGNRCNAIDALVAKFRTGWPWKGNIRLTTYGTPQLVSMGEALSKRILEVEKCKTRGDKTNAGKID